jgi:hypothetical protein
MKKHVATRKKKKLNPQWVHDSGFEIVPKRHQPTEPRVLKDYTILISAKQVGPLHPSPSTASKI